MCLQCVGMCAYCDCRTLPVVSRLSEEHGAILRAAGELRSAVTAEAPPGNARELLDELMALLRAHGEYEERCLYEELRRDDTFQQVAHELCAEHGVIYGALRRVRSSWNARGATGPLPVDRGAGDQRPVGQARLLQALDRLARHIVKEERGLFPPAVILLSSSAWERAAAREEPTPADPTPAMPH